MNTGHIGESIIIKLKEKYDHNKLGGLLTFLLELQEDLIESFEISGTVMKGLEECGEIDLEGSVRDFFSVGL